MFTPDSILTSFSYILELSPYHLLAYYPFRNKLRYPPWLLGLLVGGLLFLEFLTCCYLYSTGKDARIADLVFALIAVIIFFACVDAQLPKLIFIYVLVLDYVMIIRGISVFLIIRFFCPQGEPYLLLSSPSGIIIRLIPCLLLLPFMMYFFNITQKRVLESNAPKLWATFWLLPTMTTIIVFLFTYDFNTISTAGLIFLLARVFLLFSSIIIYHIFISSLESLRLQGEAEERIRSQEQFMALQKLQYARLQKQIEETRQARHDLRQHLNLIQAYLDTGDNETLQEYIRKYGQRLPLAPEKVYCSNYAIDTIIRYYGEKAESLGIRFDAHIRLPENLRIDEPDICIVFGNLLENAVDSCSALAEKIPFIRIHAQTAGEHAVSITVDNSCANIPTRKNGLLQSSKHPGEGIGTLSIRNIAAQYHGIADFKYENGVFYSSVFLNP